MTQRKRFKLIGAVHLFLVKNNSVLLLRRFNTGWQNVELTKVYFLVHLRQILERTLSPQVQFLWIRISEIFLFKHFFRGTVAKAFSGSVVHD